MIWFKGWFRRKWQYSQEEIAEQIAQVNDLIKQRDKLTIPEQLLRCNGAIEISQEVLTFMLDANVHKSKGDNLRALQTDAPVRSHNGRAAKG